MSLCTELEQLGMNLDSAMMRFMNNSALYEKLVKKLPKSVADLPVKEFFDQKDYDTALHNAHTLKGITGNLSLDPLFSAYSYIVDRLRDGSYKDAEDKLDEILPLQKDFCDIINKYTEN